MGQKLGGGLSLVNCNEC